MEREARLILESFEDMFENVHARQEPRSMFKRVLQGALQFESKFRDPQNPAAGICCQLLLLAVVRCCLLLFAAICYYLLLCAGA